MDAGACGAGGRHFWHWIFPAMAVMSAQANVKWRQELHRHADDDGRIRALDGEFRMP